MPQSQHPKSSVFLKVLALLLLIPGGLFALYYLIFDPQPYLNLAPASFLDTVAIPFDWVQIGPISFPIKVDNFLVFQEFKSLAPSLQGKQSLVFAGIVWLISVAALTVLSEFKRLYFIIGGVIWIVLLTLSDFNALNIYGQNTTFPLMILMAGTLIPVITLNIWGTYIPLFFKGLLLFSSTILSLALVLWLSPIKHPEIYLSEHSLLLGFGMAIAWVFWNGHSVISGIYILLARANRNIKLNIAVQIALITLVYIATLIFILQELQGELNLPFPTFSPLFLLIPMGVLGWISIQEKTKQSEQLISSPMVIKTLHILGFGMALWMVWKFKISGNQPAEELFKHLLTYSQIGFSLFFTVYLFANFTSIMNSGQAVEKVLYKPYSLVYYHVRIGGLIGMLVLTTYAEGIIGVQANAMSSNILADYFYETDQKLEAGIMYENAWMRYRKNPKAKNAVAHLLLEQNQPSQAKLHLEESFSDAPQVENIMLLSDRLHQENNVIDAAYYLERGLAIFPNSPHLANNLSLLLTKLNKTEQALAVLESLETKNPVLHANTLALKTKLGQPSISATSSDDFISQINELATSNALANNPAQELLLALKEKAESSDSPMLIQAALRNVFSQKNRENPTADLALLDSLGQKEEMNLYLMDMQETAVIRSLGAGRVTEAVKNLNGLAFRNPNDAGYYLQLSGSILAQNLDFQKSANEFIAAEEKGFQAFDTQHWSIFGLAGMPDKAVEIREKYQVLLPTYLTEEGPIVPEYLNSISTFHQSLPEKLYQQWQTSADSDLKTDMAIRIISHKAHGLSQGQLRDLAAYIQAKIGEQQNLQSFVSNPDLGNTESIKAFISWLNTGEEAAANPYLTPLIFSKLKSLNDPLEQYELLNAASEFNRDPILWKHKIEAALAVGLDNYAQAAIEELALWVAENDLKELLQSTN
ncbi:hypothetical protein PBT90_09910 [Algoriphagus halophytocola]|uniref:Tetratricopeptide repeat protein n=1 Tax=Algoriphagus halophytocola TaxID=2991499 RepID=A0ABY6MJN2_9BACT|nr:MULTISPECIES: hypothetical protein [unclassified Algoriphagus]UZD23704.1 hypothetical protein OM944_04240 [Algoriphagus sp. TR-M5]WBL44997.1 hypothetical protein PBT90_09910 [Algoriphagus sp. TR-M9]